MEPFRFCHPVSVRYADLDPQGHVNNANYLTYLEQGRAAYLLQLGLWDGQSFLDLGIVLATAEITFRSPIRLGQSVNVWVRVARIGQKSMDMLYVLEDAQGGQTLAQASTVLVTYDYRMGQSIPVPESWRAIIAEYENPAE
jgi:acyl-CoA thioester hydrolase